MDIRERRLVRLRELLAEHTHSQAALARTVKVKPAQINQWLNRRRTISEDSARAIERAAGKPPWWLDGEPSRGTQRSAPSAPVIAAEPPAVYQGAAWPFQYISQARWLSLPVADRQRIETFADATMQAWEARQPGNGTQNGKRA